MATFTLTALDVTGIQRYLFSSNRLQENVGASELVYRATHEFVFEILPKLHNVNLKSGHIQVSSPEQSFDIEKNSVLAAEVIYAGGGNTLILFRDSGEAKDFVTRLSIALLEQAPGLELLAAHIEFDWDGQSLGDSQGGVHQAVMEALSQAKHRRVTSTPLLGLGVTASCQSTGLAAIDARLKNDKYYLISAEVEAKLKAEKNLARQRLEEIIPRIKEAKLEIPFEFDDFGRTKDENSYIAVVHADGNGMGKRVRAIADQHKSPGEGNRAYIKAIREFSDRINRAGEQALADTIDKLLSAVETGQLADEISLRKNFLPFRPLVFGGDDVTFVCDGRLGLVLATHYLEAFEQRTRMEGIAAHACAGVAVVKTHYPFARAYQLAEQLCTSAKKYVRQKRQGETGDFSALDWHFAAAGLLGGLDEIRQRQYLVKQGRLYMRPVRLQTAAGDWRTWPNFTTVTTCFKTGEGWANKRNKVARLRQALREGEVAVSQYLKAYEDIEQLPAMKENAPPGIEQSGWTNDTCGYFDAIEAIDFLVEL